MIESLWNGDPGCDSLVLFALGNNHAGTVYPFAADVIPFVIDVDLDPTPSPGRVRALDVLIDSVLFWSEPAGATVVLQDVAVRVEHAIWFLVARKLDGWRSLVDLDDAEASGLAADLLETLTAVRLWWPERYLAAIPPVEEIGPGA